MRNICAVLALTLVVGCGGSDGKDGANGKDGADGMAGPTGKDGANGLDGANGKDGAPGTDGMDGAPGADGANGAAGGAILQGAGAPAAALGADGDLYLDTASHDVYQKTSGAWAVITNLSGGPPGPKGDPGVNGAPGTNGTDGADGMNGTNGSSVRTGAGAPAAALGSVGDVYIDSTTGDLYSKGAGGWTKTGNLQGPAGADGTDGAPGADGQDVKDTLGGVRWFAFALTKTFVDAPSLITGQTYTNVSSAAVFTFTGADQHGRLAFDTAGSYLPGGVDLSAYESLDVTAAATGGAVTKLLVLLSQGTQKGCQWDLVPAAGPVYNIDLSAPTSCFNNSLDADFSLSSVTQIQVGVQSSGAGLRTLTVTNVGLVDNN